MDGIILCNKPKGITSNKIARNISKKFNIKVGNTGILDFAAEGLLILVIGKATKFTSYFQNLDKEYIAVGELGKLTDTYDINGDIIKEAKVNIKKEKLNEIIKNFEGDYKMVPPPYSSKKINGKRAYKYALKGNDIELRPVNVKIYKIDILEENIPFFKIKVNCSTGTYIRSLIKDIGEKTGCLAYMYSLKRVSIGKFTLSNSIDYEKIMSLSFEEFSKIIINLNDSLYFFPQINILEIETKKFKNGQKIKIENKIYNNKETKFNNELNTIDNIKELEDNKYKISSCLKGFENIKKQQDQLIKVLDKNNNIIGLGILNDKDEIQPKIVL